MGVNMTIAIPGWDTFSNGGMKAIFVDSVRFPRVYADDPDYCEIRPIDFPLWRDEIIKLGCNVDMWLAGLDALEKDPNLWIGVSY